MVANGLITLIYQNTPRPHHVQSIAFHLIDRKILKEINKMEKVIRTFSASLSEETLEVTVRGAETDVIVQQVITDTDSDTVVCNQRIRKTMATSEAWAVIQQASGK